MAGPLRRASDLPLDTDQPKSGYRNRPIARDRCGAPHADLLLPDCKAFQVSSTPVIHVQTNYGKRRGYDRPLNCTESRINRRFSATIICLSRTFNFTIID
jgi:hypothetical protein